MFCSTTKIEQPIKGSRNRKSNLTQRSGTVARSRSEERAGPGKLRGRGGWAAGLWAAAGRRAAGLWAAETAAAGLQKARITGKARKARESALREGRAGRDGGERGSCGALGQHDCCCRGSWRSGDCEECSLHDSLLWPTRASGVGGRCAG